MSTKSRQKRVRGCGAQITSDHLCCSPDETQLFSRKSYRNTKVTLSAAGRGEHCSGGVYINHAKAAKSLETAFLGEKEVKSKKEGEFLEKDKRFCKFLASLFLSVKCVLFQLKKTQTNSI